MSGAESVYLWILGIYLIGLVYMGYFVGKRYAKSYEDYLVGGRRFTFLTLVMTYAATGMGAGFTVGTVEKGYAVGLQAALYPTAEAFGSVVLAFVMAKYMNKIGKELKMYTISQYLETLYDVRMRVIAAVITALCAAIIVGGQIIAGSSLISIIAVITVPQKAPSLVIYPFQNIPAIIGNASVAPFIENARMIESTMPGR